MDLPQPTTKPFREWQIVGLILIALIALGFGEAIKKHRNNLPATPPLEQLETPLESGEEIKIELNGQEFSVELAQTPEEQSRGLSGRASLAANRGMLFVFDEPTVPQFWMKEMNFSLDIIWIDEAKTVIGYEENVSPDSFPKTFSSDSVPLKYVLEVPAGTVAKNQVQIGDLIHFSEP